MSRADRNKIMIYLDLLVTLYPIPLLYLRVFLYSSSLYPSIHVSLTLFLVSLYLPVSSSDPLMFLYPCIPSLSSLYLSLVSFHLCIPFPCIPLSYPFPLYPICLYSIFPSCISLHPSQSLFSGFPILFHFPTE